MKKNLRNILVLAIGLMTTVSFAQEWNVDSRTRIDKSGDNDRVEPSQRATIGATWGGSNWGIHSSTEVNYQLDGVNSTSPTLSVYEAYASTDLLGYASMTIGRQALDYGSGLVMGSNQWSSGDNSRNTSDGMTFGLDLDVADVTLGYAARMDNAADGNGAAGWHMNASKSDGDWTANLLYGVNSTTTAGDEDDDFTYMGLDLGYSVSGVDLSLSYNTTDDGTTDGDMTMIGAAYNVNDQMSVHGSRTTYGDNGFGAGLISNYGQNGTDSWASHGNMGYLAANDERMSYGGSYSVGDFSLSATMHAVTNTEDTDYDRGATEFSLGYNLNDNANLSLNMASDDNGGTTDSEYMWITLNIRP
jgi:hypothetical protein